jgi:hypothetical protein
LRAICDLIYHFASWGQIGIPIFCTFKENAMPRVRLFSVVLIGLIFASSLFAADPGYKTIAIKANSCAWAIDPASGSVAALTSDENAVTLYPKAFFDGTVAGPENPVKTAAKPQFLVFKKYKDKGYFIVSNDNGTVTVYGSKALEQVKDIKLPSPAVTLTTSVNADDPYVYYCAASGGMEARPGRINLANMADDGALSLVGRNGYFSDSMCLVASADGNVLYALRRHTSPTGMISFVRTKDSAGKETWNQALYDHVSVPGYLPDPFGKYTAVNRQLYNLDLKTVIQKIDFDPVCFFNTKPVIIGLSADGVSAYSYNTLKQFGEVRIEPTPTPTPSPTPTAGPRATPVPRPTQTPRTTTYPTRRVIRPTPPVSDSSFSMLAPRTPSDPNARALTYLADDAGQRVLGFSANSVVVIPLKEFNVTDEPLLFARVQVPDIAYVGRPVAGTLEPAAKGLTVALKDGPAGLKISGTSISWTPKQEDVGTTSVEISVSSGALSTTQKFSLSVMQPSIHLPFHTQGLAMSPSGKLALAWGAARENDESDQFRPGEVKNARLVTMDLVQMKVLVDKKLLFPITTAAIDDQAVYVAPLESDRIDTLSLKDLSSDKRMNLDSKASRIEPVSPKQLLVLTSGKCAILSLPELKPIDVPLLQTALGNMNFDANNRMAISRNGYWINGFMFSKDFSGVRMLSATYLLPTVKSAAMGQPGAWNRMVQGDTLLSAQGQRIGQLTGTGARFLSDIPAVVCLNEPRNDRRENTRSQVSLKVMDLITAKTVCQIPLKERDPSRLQYQQSDPFFNGSPGILTSGKTIVVPSDNEVFVVSISDDICKALAAPLEFELPDQVASTGVQQPLKIAHKVRGGVAPIEFELKSTWEGLEIDKNTGTVTIDGSAMSKIASNAVAQFLIQTRAVLGDGTTNTGIKALKANFKKITGREALGVPVQIPVQLIASDKEQQIARLDYTVILELPEDMVQKAVEALTNARKPLPPNRVDPNENRPPVSTQSW